MKRFQQIAWVLLVSLVCCRMAAADPAAPWGRAKEAHRSYKPEKVVFDVTTGDEKALSNILDRVALLDRLYGADPFSESIVIVLHGNSIPYFAVKNFSRYRELVTRAESLTLTDTIHFRLCQAAAKARYGLRPQDIHGFIKMVPMADAEIIRLQREEGYAYMR